MNTATLFYVRLSNLIESLRDEKGADMAEYALVLVLIAVVALVAVGNVGTEVNCAFEKVVAGLQNTGTAATC